MEHYGLDNFFSRILLQGDKIKRLKFIKYFLLNIFEYNFIVMEQNLVIMLFIYVFNKIRMFD